MWPPVSADPVCPRPRAITRLYRPLQLIACSIGIAIMKFEGLRVSLIRFRSQALSSNRPGNLDL